MVRMTTPRVILTIALAGMMLAPVPVAWATLLTISVSQASHGQATARALPAAPIGATATCASKKMITITWPAVTNATSYTVYESTTSASTGYAVAATGVTATTWTSPSLAAAHYWFEVTATIGTNWASPASTATGRSTITASGCTQP